VSEDKGQGTQKGLLDNMRVETFSRGKRSRPRNVELTGKRDEGQSHMKRKPLKSRGAFEKGVGRSAHVSPGMKYTCGGKKRLEKGRKNVRLGKIILWRRGKRIGNELERNRSY